MMRKKNIHTFWNTINVSFWNTINSCFCCSVLLYFSKLGKIKTPENRGFQEFTLTFLLISWVLRDSNPRPSGCKPDALNQLS